jgi:hypothetical protein
LYFHLNVIGRVGRVVGRVGRPGVGRRLVGVCWRGRLVVSVHPARTAFSA